MNRRVFLKNGGLALVSLWRLWVRAPDTRRPVFWCLLAYVLLLVNVPVEAGKVTDLGDIERTILAPRAARRPTRPAGRPPQSSRPA